MALQVCRMEIRFMTWSCATVHAAVYITPQKPIRGKLMRTTGWSRARAQLEKLYVPTSNEKVPGDLAPMKTLINSKKSSS